MRNMSLLWKDWKIYSSSKSIVELTNIYHIITDKIMSEWICHFCNDWPQSNNQWSITFINPRANQDKNMDLTRKLALSNKFWFKSINQLLVYFTQFLKFAFVRSENWWLVLPFLKTLHRRIKFAFIPAATKRGTNCLVDMSTRQPSIYRDLGTSSR